MSYAVRPAGPVLLPLILAFSPGPGPLAVHGLGEAIALAGEDHNVRVVDQPVDEGRGQAAGQQHLKFKQDMVK